ncbi:MAG: hypothetical protein NVS9B9_10270 [Ktedonobacteraceae bacterium]
MVNLNKPRTHGTLWAALKIEVVRVLTETGNNKSEAARILGISLRTLRKWCHDPEFENDIITSVQENLMSKSFTGTKRTGKYTGGKAGTKASTTKRSKTTGGTATATKGNSKVGNTTLAKPGVGTLG